MAVLTPWVKRKAELSGMMADKAEDDPMWAIALALMELADNLESVDDALWRIAESITGLGGENNRTG